jgi:hypothetical protein
VTEAGSSGFDITWSEPMPQLLTVVEVSMACLCATTPFFWPLIQEGWNQIFVKYEFNVSSESRWHDESQWHDDHIELASTNSTAGREGLGRDGSHHKDDYIHEEVNLSTEEFRTEATVKSSGSRKKGQNVQFEREEV